MHSLLPYFISHFLSFMSAMRPSPAAVCLTNPKSNLLGTGEGAFRELGGTYTGGLATDLNKPPPQKKMKIQSHDEIAEKRRGRYRTTDHNLFKLVKSYDDIALQRKREGRDGHGGRGFGECGY
ncbi:hypothetical protein TB2_044075 [Malus domestica]